jgi:hypothetical protein
LYVHPTSYQLVHLSTIGGLGVASSPPFHLVVPPKGVKFRWEGGPGGQLAQGEKARGTYKLYPLWVVLAFHLSTLGGQGGQRVTALHLGLAGPPLLPTLFVPASLGTLLTNSPSEAGNVGTGTAVVPALLYPLWGYKHRF